MDATGQGLNAIGGKTLKIIKGAPSFIGGILRSPALRYVAKRILLACFTVWIVITVTFFAMHAVPGGPFFSEKAVSPEVEAALREKYGLDKPLIVQYGSYLGDIIKGFDFGPSLKQKGRSVLGIISDGMKTSAALGISAAAIALVVGTLLGSTAALKRGSLADRLIMVMTTAFVSVPSFIAGTLLLLIFSAYTGWLPATATGGGISGLILPVATLSLYPTAYITRLTRASMLDTLGKDYIRTARAKGLSEGKIIFRHALKNSLIPVITYFGPMLAGIVTGWLVVERIFAVPGIGRDFVGSITGRDYPLIMGTTIILSMLVVFMNTLADFLYRALDPRITLE